MTSTGNGRDPALSAADGTTFAGMWHRAVRTVGDRVFLIWEGEGEVTRSWTYAEFDDLIGRVMGDLVHRGIGAGDPVHVCLANSPAFIAIWLATAQLGAWIVPADPRAGPQELREQIRRTRAGLGICGSTSAANYRQAAVNGLDFVVVDEEDTEVEPLTGSVPAPLPAHPAPDSAAAVLFTSGTTGTPKGVVVTQANFAFVGEVMAAAARLRTEDRQLVVLPLFHANAQYYSFASAISAGASVALMGRFSASRFVDQAVRHEVTHASLFAAPIRMILASGARTSDGLQLRNVWFAQNVSEEEYDAIAALLRCRPRQLYGMTETIAAVLTSPPLGATATCMGTRTLDCQVELRDKSWREPDVGDVGEIVVRGEPGRTLFAGYFEDPETTSRAFRDGWFLTGDLARRDAAGRFFFEGRHSDLLKVSGENVSVVEIENLLMQHPDIREVAVVGRPDRIRDEVPVAYIVPVDGAAGLDIGELEAFCAKRLSPPKRPRDFHLVEELPRTSVGKVRKSFLTQVALDG